MYIQPTATQRLNTLTRIYCSNTGKRVVAESRIQFNIPSGQVTWLHCEACQGWHIIIDNARPPEPFVNIPPN